MGAKISACLGDPSWEVLHDHNVKKKASERAADGPESLKDALKRMPKVSRSHVDNAKRVPLHRCAQKGDEEGVRKLLEAGAPVNIRDRSRMTALMVACRYGHDLAARYLVNHGAEVLAVDPIYLKTSLHIAAERGHARCIEVLLSSLYPVYVKRVGGDKLGPGQKARIMVQWGRQQNSHHKLLSETQFKRRMENGGPLQQLGRALEKQHFDAEKGKRQLDVRASQGGADAVATLNEIAQGIDSGKHRATDAVPKAEGDSTLDNVAVSLSASTVKGHNSEAPRASDASEADAATAQRTKKRRARRRGRHSRKSSLSKEDALSLHHQLLPREGSHGNDSERYEDVLVDTASLVSEASWLYTPSMASTPQSRYQTSLILRELHRESLSGRTSLEEPIAYRTAPSLVKPPSLPQNQPSSRPHSRPRSRPHSRRHSREESRQELHSGNGQVSNAAGVESRLRKGSEGQGDALLRGDPDPASLASDGAPAFYHGSKPRHRRSRSDPHVRPVEAPAMGGSNHKHDGSEQRGDEGDDAGTEGDSHLEDGYGDVVTYRSMTNLVFALQEEDDEGDVRQLEEAHLVSLGGLTLPNLPDIPQGSESSRGGDGMLTPPLGVAAAPGAADESEVALLGMLMGTVPSESMVLRRQPKPKKKKRGDMAVDNGAQLLFRAMKTLGGKDHWGRVPFIDMRSRTGETALMLASGHGHVSAVELLLRHGGDVSATTRVPLSKDKLTEEERVGAEYLFNIGPGSTALHYAAACGSVDILYLLLEAGAPLELRNATGMRAHEVAESFKRHAAANMLAAPTRLQGVATPGTLSPSSSSGSARWRAGGAKAGSSLIGRPRNKSVDGKRGSEKLRRAAIKHRSTLSQENAPAALADADAVMSQLPAPREPSASATRSWRALLAKHKRSVTVAEDFTTMENPIESFALTLPRLQSMSSYPLDDMDMSPRILGPEVENVESPKLDTVLESEGLSSPPLVTIKEETPYPSSKR
eukprot:jgi/Mesvir1/28631/Mv04498-RA.2